MTPPTLEQAFQTARQHHQAGQLAQAEQLYRQILARQPNHIDALHLLGVLACQAGQNDAGADLIRQAIALKPDSGEMYNNLGSAFKAAGHLDNAIAAYRQAVALKPAYAEALSNLGNALKDNGQLDEAIAACRRAIELKPSYVSAYSNLGICLKRNGQPEQAVVAFRQAIALNPNHADHYSNLGVVLSETGLIDEAITTFHRAISLNPNSPEAFSNLGNLLTEKGNVEEALTACRQAILLKPSYADAFGNLGFALKEKGLLDEAIAVFRHAISLDPNIAEMHGNLATLLKDTGQIEEAIPEFRRAVALKPALAQAQSNLLYSLHFHPGFSAESITAEHRRWNSEQAASLKNTFQSHANPRHPDRRLKIGYVSSDFRNHPVARFLLPLLEHHDHDQFEIHCYSDKGRVDEITERLRSHADRWHEIAYQSDEQTAAQIRSDGIDVLVDLPGHTAGNRLMVFARRPAPIQVSYLGYPDTTGLTTIDYRLTDPFADPPGETDAFHAEKLHRLPKTNWCFPEPDNSPSTSAPSMSRSGHITFGSFNIVAKISDEVLNAWIKILKAVPGSHLFLKASTLAVPSVSDRIRHAFEACGIDTNRLNLQGQTPDYASHLALYRDMDIALDTFPYNGTTTTCEALWMGAPVITLAGRSHVSRVGVSLLSNAGLPQLIAKTTDEYINLAAALAEDQTRLAMLHKSLRDQMRQSPLMNAMAFARDVEAAYRQMWRTWCASPQMDG